MKLTKAELDQRRRRLFDAMNAGHPEWDTLLIVNKVNQYYFTGTMQNAVLLIRNDGSYAYYVRKSHARAQMESPLENIYPMNTYSDIAEKEGSDLGNVFIEMESLPIAVLERMKRHLHMRSMHPADMIIRTLRAVKSEYEMHWIRAAGKQHDLLFMEDVPGLLREGMTEAELVGDLFGCMMKRGYHGLSRFTSAMTEIVVGQFGFGENSLFPTCFDGPGGTRGYSASTPIGGDPNRRLKKGDLVFVDTGFGIEGYHSDKTQLYMFGAKPSEEAVKIHQALIDVERRAAERLVPGAIPAEIYQACLNELPDCLKQGFMGYPGESVKFLGHGVGLHMDELPIIANRFHQPLQENMTIALEPKKGVEGIGMLGVEDIYAVKPGGGECLSGGGRPILIV